MQTLVRCVAALVLSLCLTLPASALAQSYGYSNYGSPAPRDAVEDFLSRNTIYIRPAVGGRFADYQTVFAAIGSIRIEVICPAGRDAIGGWRDRGARVFLGSSAGAYENPAVLSTVIGAAQVQARNECHMGVVDTYDMGFVDIYGPTQGGDAPLLWSARSYALGNWSEFHDVVAEAEVERRAAEAARVEALRQQQAYAEQQRLRAVQRAESERAGASFLVGLLVVAGIVAGIWIFWKTAQAAERERQRQESARADEEAREARARRERREREEREERERREREEREERERRARQEAIRSELVKIHASSIDAFGRIPKALMTAESLLDAAENDFQESAFSPFWDDIERAVNRLGEASESVDHIRRSANRYKELTASSEHAPAAFPVEPDEAKRLVVADETGQRLKAIVRAAQRNFQFASIYEQRKTNQILVAGFANLGDAITGMGDHLSYAIRAVETSVADVSRSVQDMDESMRDAARENERVQRDLQERLSEQLAEQHDSALEAQSRRETAHAEQMKDALEMLDNIQRGRKPFP